MRRTFFIAVIITFLFSFDISPQERIDYQMMQRIREEEFNNSKLPELVSYLCDIYSPRLKYSPQYRQAAQWVLSKLQEFGLEKVHLDTCTTLGRGWELKKFYAAMTSPKYMPLISYPKAWIPGLEGIVKGNAVLLDIKSESDFEAFRGKLKGAIVLLKGEQPIFLGMVPDGKRFTDDDLRKMQMAEEVSYDPSIANAWKAQNDLQQKITRFLKEEGAAVILEPSPWGTGGTLFVQNGGSFRKGSRTPIPSIVVSAEQYNRMVRILKKNIPVTLEIEIQADFIDADSLAFNIMAEIPGTDKKLKDEVVIFGAHFDTWHSGTGATDNSAGCAVVIEAARILRTLDIKPRRTIRLALWDAEEMGSFGSKGYVKNHFFDMENQVKKSEYDKLSAYFNLDNGSGKIRGIYSQSNIAVMSIFDEWLRIFHDLHATTVTSRNAEGTDDESFDEVGLPGFQFIQDPLEYDSRTWHSNMDVYDHVSQSDLSQAAVIMAAFIYNTAMRDEKLPRKHFDLQTSK